MRGVRRVGRRGGSEGEGREGRGGRGSDVTYAIKPCGSSSHRRNFRHLQRTLTAAKIQTGNDDVESVKNRKCNKGPKR